MRCSSRARERFRKDPLTDSNRSRELHNQRFLRNKQAFDEVFGDPFAKPEPIEGEYQRLRKRSSTMTAKLDMDESRTTANPATPSVIDFFCDAEHVAGIALTDKSTPENTGDTMTELFTATYIHETTTNAFTPAERSKLEQHIGRLLLAYGIAPTSRYFRAVRQSRQPLSS